MLDLLTEGSAARTDAYYIHRGDLQWWLFYSDTPEEIWSSMIRLSWEGNRLLAWALLSPEQNAIDVFTVPELHGGANHRQMVEWAADRMPGRVEIGWTSEEDRLRTELLTACGFEPAGEGFVHLERPLDDDGLHPDLPDGFTIRTSRGNEDDARLRSVASHGAFASTRSFDDYWPRTWRFMQSPVYVPENELFVMSPEGRVASSCIVWIDHVTRVGHFEPVGTHPDFRRRGLGRALLLEAMRRLRSAGLGTADVCTETDNDAALGLYESVGFRKRRRLLTHVREGP